jgi:hypothetical protein
MRSFFLSLLFCAVAWAQPQSDAGTLQNHDPEKALLTANDMTLFWKAYDHWAHDLKADPVKLPEVLQKEYLDPGSQGVKDFIPNRIVSAQKLSQTILGNRTYYENLHRSSERIQGALPEIRKNFQALKKLYPDAVFPPVYFVVGALNSGGTSSDHGLIIGADMLSDQNPYAPTLDPVAIVMHELVHFQQKHPESDLLAACLREGAADFVSELVAGRNINEQNKAYGDSHEEELWRKFQEDIKRSDRQIDWLGNYDEAKRVGAPDLGYYMGYKISQAYYQSAKDKTAALKMIVEMRDPEKLLAISGYGKRFSNQAVN